MSPAGCLRISVRRKTPETVVINEALDIARKFSTQESAQFVNGHTGQHQK
jgi:transcription termination factor NusB